MMSNHSIQKNTDRIKVLSAAHGFMFCGISKAEHLSEDARRLEGWLKKGSHGKMSYMENHFEKRVDPTKLVPGAKSVISLAYNYFPEKDCTSGRPYKISKYAYGKDYHFVIKNRLKNLVHDIRQEVGDFDGRVFVDSAPVLERVWAKKSGMGWIGKHTLLLNRHAGSFFFLAEIISDLNLIADGPIKDYCGTCTRCMDACPTNAIPAPYELDATRCISYLTIELKDSIPMSLKENMEQWIFGCDICQDVCPWNRFSKPHHEPDFRPGDWVQFSSKDWEEMTQEVFASTFRQSPVKRTKFEGLKRNIRLIQKE
jgi:epoxyqueuosine reductase